MKIGVILVGYNMEEHVTPCLWPWVNWRYTPQSNGHELLICAVNTPFEGFPVEPPDRTREYLQARVALGEINHLITSDASVKETEARERALYWLVHQGVDLIWQLDLDERYAQEDITNILGFVENTPFTVWYRLSLRNAVFDDHTFLVDPFTPPRIHRVRAGAYRAHSFSADNDVAYGGTITRDIVPQDRFPSMTVPSGVAFVRHLSWLNDDRSRRKIAYQLEGRGWPECSFRWDETKGLQFNEAYYAKRGLPLPEVVSE